MNDKRQLIYASLIRYAPEAVPLRERVLDRLVMNALSASSVTNPHRLGTISKNLALGPGAHVRAEVVQEALARLIAENKVVPTLLRKRHAYYLTDGAKEEVQRLIESSEDLFQPVLQRLLENTDHLVKAEIGASICQSFICESFSRFGTAIAQSVTGQTSGDYIAQLADISAAFETATEGKFLSLEARDSLEARCLGFLKSTEPQDVRLKFYLTQGYYFAHLLGLPGTGFNPLAEEAFSGSVFYLDTNVLVVGLLTADNGSELFRELVEVSKNIGVTLRVTRATINEARRAAADRCAQIHQILEALPVEVAVASRDQFVTEFMEARESNPTLTPEEFLAPFDHLNDTLQDRWGIEVDERIEDDMLHGRDLIAESVIIQDSAVTSRGWDKSDRILAHDVGHYALVMDERKTLPKTWFLTRDRTLALAASRLAGRAELPFCFSLIGFLQSLSPFMTTNGGGPGLAAVFSVLLRDQLLPPERLFSTKELVLLVEMHRDVLSTPKEQLLEALDYVKHTVLEGKPYKASDCPKVALGLRTFLACSADQRRKELEAQATRLRARASRTTSAAKNERQLRKRIQESLEAREAELSELVEENQSLQQLLDAQKARDQRWRLTFAIVGAMAATIWWLSSPLVARLLTEPFPKFAQWQVLGPIIIGSAGSLMFCLPALFYIRGTTWTETTKTATMAVLLLISLASSRMMDRGVWARSWTGILEAAAMVATVAIGIYKRTPPKAAG